MRPWQVREHILGTSSDSDRLVMQRGRRVVRSDCARHTLGGVDRDRVSQSRHQRVLQLPAGDTDAPLRSVAGRRRGIEYTVDHAPTDFADEVLMVTNDGAAEFRILAAGTDALEPWREVVAHDPAVRIVAADAFAGQRACSQCAGTACRCCRWPAGTGRPP